jgi:DNA-binding FadR family transcriptional regulator
MEAGFSKIKAESLKELFVKDIEAKIISGQLRPGEKLPPERELAAMTGVSRSIVNSGIIELSSKGFVRVIPRRGTIVEDYKNEGTSSMLSSIMNYHEGKLSLRLFNNMMDTRLLIEVESAGLAAENRTEEDLIVLQRLLNAAQEDDTIENRVNCNYNFHHRVTLASGNMVYAMIFKSFEPACKNLIRYYFQTGDYLEQSLLAHVTLFDALKEQNKEKAKQTMEEILLEGRNKLALVAVTE